MLVGTLVIIIIRAWWYNSDAISDRPTGTSQLFPVAAIPLKAFFESGSEGTISKKKNPDLKKNVRHNENFINTQHETGQGQC